MGAWPQDHTIVVYLCVDNEFRPVGTARQSSDVPHLLRHLASAWEEYGSLPIPEQEPDIDIDFLFVDLLWDGLPASR